MSFYFFVNNALCLPCVVFRWFSFLVARTDTRRSTPMRSGRFHVQINLNLNQLSPGLLWPMIKMRASSHFAILLFFLLGDVSLIILQDCVR